MCFVLYSKETLLYILSKRREEGRSREEYMAIFQLDLSTYYSYNTFLMEKLLNMFGPTELIEFLEANEMPRPVTIRTNTLKVYWLMVERKIEH